MGQGLATAAQAYAEECGWTSIALGLDGQGYPKRPILKGWTEFGPDDWRRQPWERAKGIGLLLGPPSGNLAVIDVDDVPLSDAIWALFIRQHLSCRMVRTVRGRLHVYVQEETPSSTHPLKVQYQGRTVAVELRATGVQVTAPPSPGYSLTGYEDSLDGDPIAVPSIADAWASLAKHLGIEAVATPANGSAGYPSPWQPTVVKGDRNRAAYVEAKRLCDARMPLDQALDVVRMRYEQNYESGDIGWKEIEMTVRSAYRGGPSPTAPTLKWSMTK